MTLWEEAYFGEPQDSKCFRCVGMPKLFQESVSPTLGASLGATFSAYLEGNNPSNRPRQSDVLPLVTSS